MMNIIRVGAGSKPVLTLSNHGTRAGLEPAPTAIICRNLIKYEPERRLSNYKGITSFLHN